MRGFFFGDFVTTSCHGVFLAGVCCYFIVCGWGGVRVSDERLSKWNFWAALPNENLVTRENLTHWVKIVLILSRSTRLCSQIK
jgi:hypothetical protein